MENKETTCTPCEQNFERKVNELVKEGEAPDTKQRAKKEAEVKACLLYISPSPRDGLLSRMPSSA